MKGKIMDALLRVFFHTHPELEKTHRESKNRLWFSEAVARELSFRADEIERIEVARREADIIARSYPRNEA